MVYHTLPLPFSQCKMLVDIQGKLTLTPCRGHSRRQQLHQPHPQYRHRSQDFRLQRHLRLRFHDRNRENAKPRDPSSKSHLHGGSIPSQHDNHPKSLQPPEPASPIHLAKGGSDDAAVDTPGSYMDRRGVKCFVMSRIGHNEKQVGINEGAEEGVELAVNPVLDAIRSG